MASFNHSLNISCRVTLFHILTQSEIWRNQVDVAVPHIHFSRHQYQWTSGSWISNRHIRVGGTRVQRSCQWRLMDTRESVARACLSLSRDVAVRGYVERVNLNRCGIIDVVRGVTDRNHCCETGDRDGCEYLCYETTDELYCNLNERKGSVTKCRGLLIRDNYRVESLFQEKPGLIFLKRLRRNALDRSMQSSADFSPFFPDRIACYTLLRYIHWVFSLLTLTFQLNWFEIGSRSIDFDRDTWGDKSFLPGSGDIAADNCEARVTTRHCDIATDKETRRSRFSCYSSDSCFLLPRCSIVFQRGRYN